jgi:hypothetical protein
VFFGDYSQVVRKTETDERLKISIDWHRAIAIQATKPVLESAGAISAKGHVS